MLCSQCGKRIATTHIRTDINGKITEADLCEKCASERNINFGKLPFSNLFNLNSLNGISNDYTDAICVSCGKSFSQIAETGLCGCSKCYEEFYKQLMPTIRKIHGRTFHIGKIPVSSAPRISSETRLESLKKRMAEAVKQENFELAATLRDSIKQLEGNINE